MFFKKEEIKNLKKTSDRIKKAIDKKEKIIIYSDADLDGSCAAIILEESIKNLGGEIAEVYFPDREKEGYGINESALLHLKKHAPALLISADCGIGNVKEVEIAKKLGFEVIIIDHHEVLEKVPKASIIVDPKQKGDTYPFKELSATGVVFKLSEVLLGEESFLRNNFLELTALATIADMMPQVADNKMYIFEGLNSLEKTLRPGLQVFWGMDSVKGLANKKMIASKIISAMNAASIIDHLTESYLLLNASDIETAEILASNLVGKSEEKHLKIKEIMWEVQERIMKDFACPIIFEGDNDWSLIFMGPVASLICRDFQKPVFLYGKGKEISRGAVRTPKGLNSVEAMKSCGDLLVTFGGHPSASGFAVENKNLDKFKKCLIDYFSDVWKR